MAGDWIKMRGALLTNPRIIRMARLLLQDPEFLEWYSNDGVTLESSPSVTRRHVTVVTRVTVGGLLPVWASVNDCADQDGLLRDASLFEIDEMAGVPGFGRAMQAVGWLHELPDSEGLEFPNFIEHNTVGKERSTSAKTQAERAKEYRERKLLNDGKRHEIVTNSVTEKSDASRDTVTTEKRREEKKEREPKGSSSPAKLPTADAASVIDLYHDILPEMPRVKLQTKDRTRAIGKTWSWVLTSKKSDGSPRATTADEALAWFRSYFERARCNDFLMSKTPRTGEHANWKCDLDFLLTERGMKHVIEKTETETA